MILKSFKDKDYYYVDKTLMIKDILDDKVLVTLFTRPRRFGKTLNLSMLKYFFEKTQEDNMEADDELKFYKIYNGEGEDTLLLNNGDLIEIFNNQDKLIRETFGNKYDEALKQMWEYIDSLNILTTKEGDSLILTMNHPYKKNIQFYYNFSEDFSKDSSSEIDIDDIFIPNDDNDQIIPSSKRPPQ